MAHDVTAAKAENRITPRTLSAPDLSGVPRHWLAGDPFLTSLFNALSLVFPGGERFFMESVRALRDQVKDPKLQADVRGFLAQEALHSREHASFNQWLTRFGINASGIMAGIDAGIAERKARRTPLQNLAVTCALEHFTAIMATGWLTDERLRADADERLRALWTWHALEEVEHKAVAFDVYQAAGGDYQTRVQIMMRITVGFMLGVSVVQMSLLTQEGRQRDYRNIAAGLFRLWGPRGMFSRLIPAYARYYLPRFHPSQHDQTALLARFDAELRAMGAVMPLARAA